MRVVAKKYILLGLLDKVFSVASKTSVSPVLQNIQVRADGDTLTAIGSDSEVMVVTKTRQVAVQQSGVALLPAKAHAAVRLSEDDDITLETAPDGATVTITCRDARTVLVLERDEYPTLDMTHARSFRVSKEKLGEALKGCYPAISADTLRQMFAFVQIHGGVMRASDGNRLHQIPFPADVSLLVPARAVGEILKRVKTTVLDQIEVGETAQTYTFAFDDDLLIATKNTLDYPDVKGQMIDPAAANTLEITVDRKALLAAVGRVALTADEETRFLSIILQDNRLTVETLDQLHNTARESIAVFWPHPRQELGVNHVFLTEMLESMSSPQVTIFTRTHGKPGSFPLAIRDDGFSGILMQLRSDLSQAVRQTPRARPANGATPRPPTKGGAPFEVIERDGGEVDDDTEDTLPPEEVAGVLDLV